MWGWALTQGCAGYTLYLFMTWLPSYLAATRGMDVLKTGLFSAIPAASQRFLDLAWAGSAIVCLKQSGSSNAVTQKADRRDVAAVVGDPRNTFRRVDLG